MIPRRGQYLFVYGSLLTGSRHRHVDHLLARHGRRVGHAYIHGRLYDLGRYPGAVPSRDAQERVYGMLYKLLHFERVIRHLDEYEDYIPGNAGRSEFVRTKINAVVTTHDRHVTAWVYFYNRRIGNTPRIASGDYINYKKPA